MNKILFSTSRKTRKFETGHALHKQNKRWKTSHRSKRDTKLSSEFLF